MNLSIQNIRGIFSHQLIKKYTFGVLTLISLMTVSTMAACQTTVFSTAGAHTYTVPSYAGPFEPGDVIERVELTVTIVGGGGGGGRGQGAGGGGGGQVRVITIEVNSGDVFPITVGSGGAGGTAPIVNGSNGMASNFNGESAAGGLGGNGGNAGRGGNGGHGFSGGSGSSNGTRRSGGGGAGASEVGWNALSTSAPPRAIGGNGGAGVGGYGGGGGGAAQGGNGVGNNILGLGRDGGSNGSAGNALAATSGGGGGGGGARGGNGGDGLVIVSVSYSILPVALLEFNATFEEKNKLTRIRWSTATESESSHFEIERSFGKANDFLKVGEVMAMGWKDDISEYEFIDKNLPLFGGTIYYRIKQVDLNGSYVYSELMSINIPKTEAAKGVWRAYPNPTSGDQLRVGLMDESLYTSGERISFRLVHATMAYPFTTVSSISELNDSLATMVGALEKGLYILDIRWRKKVEYIKIFRR